MKRNKVILTAKNRIEIFHEGYDFHFVMAGISIFSIDDMGKIIWSENCEKFAYTEILIYHDAEKNLVILYSGFKFQITNVKVSENERILKWAKENNFYVSFGLPYNIFVDKKSSQKPIEKRPYKNIPQNSTTEGMFEAIVEGRLEGILHKSSDKYQAIKLVVDKIKKKEKFQNAYGFVEEDIWQKVLERILNNT